MSLMARSWSEPARPPEAGGTSSFAHVLEGLSREIDAGESGVRADLQSIERGGDLGPARLIALQVGVYRVSEALEVASRLVDRVAGGVKTVVQGGGQ